MTPEELYNNPMHAHAFTALFTLMRAHAIVTLTYNFDGSGDSGNLDYEPEWTGLHEGSDVKLEDIPCDVVLKKPAGQQMQGNKWVQLYEEQTCQNLRALGYEVAGIVLNNDPHDWYNNDGGYGNIVFSVTPEGNNKIFCDMNVREVSSLPCPDEIEFAHNG